MGRSFKQTNKQKTNKQTNKQTFIVNGSYKLSCMVGNGLQRQQVMHLTDLLTHLFGQAGEGLHDLPKATRHFEAA